MRNTELLIDLRIIFIGINVEVRLLNRNTPVRIIPCLLLIECARSFDLQLLVIMKITQIAAVAQLPLQQIVVSVEFTLYFVVGLNSSHFSERLNVHLLEGPLEGFLGDILEEIRIIREAWTTYDGDVALVALNDDISHTSNVVWQDIKCLALTKRKHDCISGYLFAYSKESFLQLGVEDLACIDRDKWANMRIDLRYNEGVDIEELSQSLHREILSNRAVLERHTLRARIIVNDVPIVELLHQINTGEHPWDSTGGCDC